MDGGDLFIHPQENFKMEPEFMDLRSFNIFSDDPPRGWLKSKNRHDIDAPEFMYPIQSRIVFVALNKDQSRRWLKFKKRHERKTPIELDHPFVPVVTDFAVAAYNELCRMYFKKGVEENIYEAQIIDVIYSPRNFGCVFYITLEAMEEDVAGVYVATVLCKYRDGESTLIKFVRSPSAPVGKKFMGMSDLIRKKFMYQAVKEHKNDIKDQLLIGRKRSIPSAEIIRLEKSYKVAKGAFRVFDKYANRLKPISWMIKKSDPGDWYIPNKKCGLHPRGAEHSCGGYDYYTPLTKFHDGYTMNIKEFD